MSPAVQPATDRATPTRHAASAREVWIVQRFLAHYRQPFFERLDDRLSKVGFALKVVFDRQCLEGPADPTRSYCDPFVRLREHRILGSMCWTQDGLITGIRSRCPAAVVVEGSPRIITNFRVPGAIRASGGVALLWTKGQTEDGTPKGFLTDFLRFRFADRFDGAICYGYEGKRELERLGLSPNRVTIARNTIDTSRIFALLADREAAAEELRRMHGLQGRRIVLYCGTMYPKKRQLDLVEAWPAIRAAHPDAVLVMVGGGEMLEEVRRRAAERCGEDARILGRVPEGEDYRWIGACDVSVMCGGLGLAIQQSLAFGRPMVVADEPGVDGEIVRDGETGWRYPRGDVPALAATVNRVLGDPAAAALMARRGQDLVRNEVNIEGMVNGFVTALERAGVLPRN